MFFAADSTETVVSPTDAVFSNVDQFDSWWQVSNCKTGGGELRFYKTNGITKCSIALIMRNRLWYFDQDASSTIYRSKIASTSYAFIHAVHGSTLHHPCHHRLCGILQGWPLRCILCWRMMCSCRCEEHYPSGAVPRYCTNLLVL